MKQNFLLGFIPDTNYQLHHSHTVWSLLLQIPVFFLAVITNKCLKISESSLQFVGKFLSEFLSKGQKIDNKCHRQQFVPPAAGSGHKNMIELIGKHCFEKKIAAGRRTKLVYNLWIIWKPLKNTATLISSECILLQNTGSDSKVSITLLSFPSSVFCHPFRKRCREHLCFSLWRSRV